MSLIKDSDGIHAVELEPNQMLAIVHSGPAAEGRAHSFTHQSMQPALISFAYKHKHWSSHTQTHPHLVWSSWKRLCRPRRTPPHNDTRRRSPHTPDRASSARSSPWGSGSHLVGWSPPADRKHCQLSPLSLFIYQSGIKVKYSAFCPH